MALIINKSGTDRDGNSYPFLYVEINPVIELHYDRVSINTKCFNGLDVSNYGFEGWWDASLVVDPSGNYDASVWVNPIKPLQIEEWDRFDPIKAPFEDEASTNLISWSLQKSIVEITTTKNVPYEYMQYENDVFELDASTGEPVIDPSTGQPIKLHTTGELITKGNGTYMFYTRTLPIFCETVDVSIV